MSSQVYLYAKPKSPSSVLFKTILSTNGLDVGLYSSPVIPKLDCVNHNISAFISAQWLTELENNGSLFFDVIQRTFTNVFVYDWNNSIECNSLLSSIFPESSIEIKHSKSMSWDSSVFCKSLSGLSAPYSSEVFVFSLKPGEVEYSTPIVIDNSPSLIVMNKNNVNTFFMAGCFLDNLSATVSSDEEADFYLMTITPILLFLQNYLHEFTWHSFLSMGCFIIDDALLKPNYGFLNYKELAESISSLGSVSISFIPWNYNRTDHNCAKIFRSNFPSLSINIHGCDHTWGEFDCLDLESAHNLVKEVEKRMTMHNRNYNIPCDNVIVFPQNMFSLPAIKALSESSIIAAISTTHFPANNKTMIKATDLTMPVFIINGFPLFKRRLPDQSIGIALDRLLDRPAFYEEHHAYFMNGYNKIIELFKEKSNTLWTNPESIITKYFQTKTNNEGIVSVRFFSSNFTYNHKKQSGTVFFETKAVGTFPKSVHLNGKEIVFKYSDKTVSFSSFVMQDCEILISITKQTNLITGKYSKNFKQRLYIRQRRYFSEFRDNYISKYKPISNLYEFIRNLARH